MYQHKAQGSRKPKTLTQPQKLTHKGKTFWAHISKPLVHSPTNMGLIHKQVPKFKLKSCTSTITTVKWVMLLFH